MQIVIAGGKADSFQTCFKQMKGEVVDNVFMHPFLHTAITFFFIPNLKKEWHMVQKKTDGLEMPTGYRRRLRITFGSPLLVSQLPFQLPAERKKGKHLLDLSHLLTAALTNSSSRLSAAILAAEEPQACFVFVFVFLEIVSFLFVLSVLQVFIIEPSKGRHMCEIC